MSQTSWNVEQIEQVVQEVLAALGVSTPRKTSPSAQGTPSTPSQTGAGELKPQTGAGQRTVPSRSPTEPQASDSAARTAVEDGQVRITGRLVTMADLWGQGVPEDWAGVRRVVVRPDALVTPLVRDELQRRNIPLVADLSLATASPVEAGPRTSGPEGLQPGAVLSRREPAASAALADTAVAASQGPMGQHGLLLVVHGKSYEPAGLIRTLSSEGVPMEVHGAECIFAATDRLAEAVRSGRRLGVLLTKYPAIGVCAANRHAGVRAVWGIEASQAAAAVASLGANVLVIAPRETAPYQLKKMIREFYQGGVRPCPEVLKSRLG